MRAPIVTDAAPRAIGPYSQAITAGGLVWVSGQVPIDPASGELIQGSIEEQTRRVLVNVQAILRAAGTDLDHVVKVTVYMVDLGQFEAMNAVYGSFFGEVPPARATVEVRRLPRGARIEVDAVAMIP